MHCDFTFKIQGEVVATNCSSLIPLVDKTCSLESLYELERFLKKQPDADVSGGDVEHHFSTGLYARELHLKANDIIVGELHLKGQINFLLKGTIVVTTAEGVKTLTAPQMVVSPPGTKRAGYALTDVTWVTVCHTNEETPEAAFSDLIATGLDDPRLEGAKLCLLEQ